MQKFDSLLSRLRSQTVLLFVALLVVIADQLTKLWVRENLAVSESCPEEGFLRLTHIHNTGIVFGLSVHKAVPLVLTVVVIALVLFLARRYAALDSRLIKVSVGLFLGGSVGNLIDRLRLGYVTDFVDVALWGDFHWPAFNAADMAVVLGIILLIYFWIRSARAPKHA